MMSSIQIQTNWRKWVVSFSCKLLILAACVGWLCFAIYLWNKSASYAFPPLADWLERLMLRCYCSGGSAKMYILSAPAPVLAFLLLKLDREARTLAPRLYEREGLRRGCRIGGYCLVGLTSFFGLFASALPYTPGGFQNFVNRVLFSGGAAKQSAGVHGLAAAYVYIGLTALVLILAGSVWMLARWAKTAPASVWKIRIRMILACGGITFLVTAAALLLLTVLDGFVPGVSVSIYNFCSRNAAEKSLFLVTILFAPVYEEIIFRGVLLPMSAKALPKWLAVLFSAVCFGLWHRNVAQFSYTFVWGVIFGILVLSTGRIFEPMLMHFLSNLLAVLTHSDSAGDVLGAQPFWVGLARWLGDLGPGLAFTGFVLCIGATVVLMRFILRENRKELVITGK